MLGNQMIAALLGASGDSGPPPGFIPPGPEADPNRFSHEGHDHGSGEEEGHEEELEEIPDWAKAEGMLAGAAMPGAPGDGAPGGVDPAQVALAGAQGPQGPQVATTGTGQAVTPQVIAANTAALRAPPPSGGKTGIGANLDELISASPTLTSNMDTLLAAGWRVVWGPPNGGSYADRPGKRIVIAESHAGNASWTVQTLAHESGHALYTPDAPVAAAGRSREEYVDTNVMSLLKDEGEASIMNMIVRDEIMNSDKKVDIGVAGMYSQQYKDAYAGVDVNDPAQRDALRATIGRTIARERPSTDPGGNYYDYYAKGYREYYDRYFGPPAATTGAAAGATGPTAGATGPTAGATGPTTTGVTAGATGPTAGATGPIAGATGPTTTTGPTAGATGPTTTTGPTAGATGATGPVRRPRADAHIPPVRRTQPGPAASPEALFESEGIEIEEIEELMAPPVSSTQVEPVMDAQEAAETARITTTPALALEAAEEVAAPGAAAPATATETEDPMTRTTRAVYEKHVGALEEIEVTAETGTLKNEADAFKAHWEANRTRYEAVALTAHIPAQLIAALHWRESSGDFSTYLHQGDPLGVAAVHVPNNIPIFTEWEEAASHALGLKSGIQNQLEIDENTTDEARLATYAEFYNGLGYHNRDTASPYVYSGTDEYSAGKYVRDGKYDATFVDRQLGVISMMRMAGFEGGDDQAEATAVAGLRELETAAPGTTPVTAPHATGAAPPTSGAVPPVVAPPVRRPTIGRDDPPPTRRRRPAGS